MADTRNHDISSNPHMSALTAKHAALEAQIEKEQTRLQPDTMKLQDLKRQKLAIKDSLAT